MQRMTLLFTSIRLEFFFSFFQLNFVQMLISSQSKRMLVNSWLCIWINKFTQTNPQIKITLNKTKTNWKIYFVQSRSYMKPTKYSSSHSCSGNNFDFYFAQTLFIYLSHNEMCKKLVYHFHKSQQYSLECQCNRL